MFNYRQIMLIAAVVVFHRSFGMLLFIGNVFPVFYIRNDVPLRHCGGLNKLSIRRSP